jgi:(p)ppGpp synthase/HD superfamily hydrolase
MAIDVTIEKLLELIMQVLPILKPSQYDQIVAEINTQRKVREEKVAKFKKAIAEMDVAVLNSLIDELLG